MSSGARSRRREDVVLAIVSSRVCCIADFPAGMHVSCSLRSGSGELAHIVSAHARVGGSDADDVLDSSFWSDFFFIIVIIAECLPALAGGASRCLGCLGMIWPSNNTLHVNTVHASNGDRATLVCPAAAAPRMEMLSTRSTPGHNACSWEIAVRTFHIKHKNSVQRHCSVHRGFSRLRISTRVVVRCGFWLCKVAVHSRLSSIPGCCPFEVAIHSNISRSICPTAISLFVCQFKIMTLV